MFEIIPLKLLRWIKPESGRPPTFMSVALSNLITLERWQMNASQ